MDLEQRVIEVIEVVQGDEIKLKDKLNKIYNIRKKKNDGNDTFAFVSYIKMGGGDINGKLVDVRFDRYTNKHGTESRGIKMIEWAKPLTKVVKEVTKDLPEPIEELTETPSQQPAEKPDWDAINAEKDAKYDARDAKKTKDIHKQVALKIAGYNLTEVARVDFEKEPDRLNDLANVITRFADED